MAKRKRQYWKLLPIARAIGILSTSLIIVSVAFVASRDSVGSIEAAASLLVSAVFLSLVALAAFLIIGIGNRNDISVSSILPSTLGLPAVTQSIALSDHIGGNVALTSGFLVAGGIAPFCAPRIGAHISSTSGVNASRLNAFFNDIF